MLLPHYNSPEIVEAGCDEAGRGCLAGSVYAAAVILPPDYDNPQLNDSKKLTAQQRYALREQIEHDAVAWAVGVVTPAEIDRMNILHASFLAMNRAVAALSTRPEALIIDGNRFEFYEQLGGEQPDGSWTFPQLWPTTRERPMPYTCIVKGDGKYQAIAAASILAKTFRDDYMDDLARQYPYYDWEHNKGYPTPRHYAGIAAHGLTPVHRKTFRTSPRATKKE